MLGRALKRTRRLDVEVNGWVGKEEVLGVGTSTERQASPSLGKVDTETCCSKKLQK